MATAPAAQIGNPGYLQPQGQAQAYRYTAPPNYAPYMGAVNSAAAGISSTPGAYNAKANITPNYAQFSWQTPNYAPPKVNSMGNMAGYGQQQNFSNVPAAEQWGNISQFVGNPNDWRMSNGAAGTAAYSPSTGWAVDVATGRAFQPKQDPATGAISYTGSNSYSIDTSPGSQQSGGYGGQYSYDNVRQTLGGGGATPVSTANYVARGVHDQTPASAYSGGKWDLYNAGGLGAVNSAANNYGMTFGGGGGGGGGGYSSIEGLSHASTNQKLGRGGPGPQDYIDQHPELWDMESAQPLIRSLGLTRPYGGASRQIYSQGRKVV